MLDELMSPRELAEYLDMPLETIYAWRSHLRGGPEGVRIGRHVRYRKSDVEKWISSKYATTAESRPQG